MKTGATTAAEQGLGATGAEEGEREGQGEEEEMCAVPSAEDLNDKFRQVSVRAGAPRTVEVVREKNIPPARFCRCTGPPDVLCLA